MSGRGDRIGSGATRRPLLGPPTPHGIMHAAGRVTQVDRSEMQEHEGTTMRVDSSVDETAMKLFLTDPHLQF